MNHFLRRLPFVASNEAAAGNEGGGFGPGCREIDLMSVAVLLRSWACDQITVRAEGLCPHGVKFPPSRSCSWGDTERKQRAASGKGRGLNARSLCRRAGRESWVGPCRSPTVGCLFKNKTKTKKTSFLSQTESQSEEGGVWVCGEDLNLAALVVQTGASVAKPGCWEIPGGWRGLPVPSRCCRASPRDLNRPQLGRSGL